MDSEVLELVIHNSFKIVFKNDKMNSYQNEMYSILDADTIETFTLEGFKELLISYLNENKDFIIARVITQDSSSRSIFYSYYSAVELNKILFCIGNNNNLLYRIRARNPINNLKILGEVSYYKITFEILKELINNSKGNESNNEIMIEAEYFASDEDLLFHLPTKEYFAKNFPDRKEYLPCNSEMMENSINIIEEQRDDDNDDKFSLKIILYTNIGTILTVFGMCMFLGSNEIFLTAIAPLTLTLFFSIFFLILYVILFETPEGILSIFNSRKIENV